MKKLAPILLVLLGFFCGPAAAQIVGALPFQLQNGTTADATQVMADFNKILNDVNTNAAKNGVNTDITALTALSTPITPAQGGTTIYFASTSGGTANAQTVASPTPLGFTLAVGKRVTFIAGFTNTSAMQLNVNSTGLTNVFRQTPAGPVALIGGEVVAGNYIEAVYDGTRYVLYTPAITPGYTNQTTLASATTTDLGTISSHNVSVTGTTTITSFGSTALTAYPIYRVKFTGILTLTHNATSLILPGSANIVTAAGDNLVAQYLGSGNWEVISYSKVSGAAVATAVPTRQVFTSGSGTYNTPANTRWISVELCGGGGGGWGSGSTGATAGGNGTNTTFSTFTGGLGSGGAGQTTAGVAGSGTGGTINLTGGNGGPGSAATTANSGGAGGISKFGAAGAAGAAGGGAGQAASANSCSGGGGGGANTTPNSGAGGGAGGYVFGAITSPAATYSYSVGTGGTAGAAGTGGGVGGAGAAGIIIVTEYY